MKRVLLPLLSLIMAIGVGIPIATPVAAVPYPMVYLGMNVDFIEPPPQGPSPFIYDDVREAVYIALDRDAIAASVGYGKVVSIATPSIPNPYVNTTCDPDYAKELLFNADYPLGFHTDLYTTINMEPLGNTISEYLLAVGIVVDVQPLPPAEFFSRLSNHELPFFLAAAPVDTAVPQELLGRLLLSYGFENYTGYDTEFFDYLFEQGRYRDAETSAFDPSFPYSMPIVPLFWCTPYYTVKVTAVSAKGSVPEPPLPGVPITWDKTGGMPPDSGVGTTLFPICQAAGDVTLTAPLNYSDEQNFYIFENWVVVTPQPPLPPIIESQPPYQRTIAFAADTNKTAVARYQPQISSLGQIYPEMPDVNPVGIEHTVWVNVFRPVDGVKVPVSGIKVIFNINGANSAASGFAYSDATGKATFAYTGDNAGLDIIWAYIDSDKNGQWDYLDENGNGQFDSGEPCEPRTVNQTSKSWVENYIIGAGLIQNENGIWNFSFKEKLRVLPEGGVAGQFQIVHHGGAEVVVYNIDQFFMLSFYGGETGHPPASNNTVRFRGTGNGSDGSTVELLVIIEDASVGKDKIAVVEVVPGPPPPAPPVTVSWIGNIPTGPPPQDPPTLDTIDGGNFQIHNMK